MLVGEVKIAALKECEENYDESIGVDNLPALLGQEKYASRLYSITEQMNRCLNIMATNLKLPLNTYDFQQTVYENKTNTQKSVQYIHKNEDIIHSANYAKSYYFEATAGCKAYIEINDGNGWVTAKGYKLNEDNSLVEYDLYIEVTNQKGVGYSAFKGRIKNLSNYPTRIRFTGSHAYSYKNVALFDVDFISNDACPVYSDTIRYKLRELIPDFYKFYRIVYDRNKVSTGCANIEGGDTLVVDYDDGGAYKIIYHPLPKKIKQFILKDVIAGNEIIKETIEEATDDYDDIGVPDELATLIPLYCKYGLYKLDEPSLAEEALMEFERRLAVISRAEDNPCRMKNIWSRYC